MSHKIRGRTAADIARSVEDAVRAGGFLPDQLLPPIRGLAASLRVSPVTVAAAYLQLQARGVLVASRRRGTRVRPGSASVEHPVEPRGGRMIAVNVDRPETDARAIEILKRRGARDVRRAEGRWSDGSWRDFDPRAPLAAV